MEGEYIYNSSDGKRTPVSQMNNSHLLNALLSMVGKLTKVEGLPLESGEGLKKGIDALKAEVLKRMPIK